MCRERYVDRKGTSSEQNQRESKIVREQAGIGGVRAVSRHGRDEMQGSEEHMLFERQRF